MDENKVKQFVTLYAFEFIDRLVKLVPDKNLKLICYYGLYSRRTSAKLQNVFTSLGCEKVSVKSKCEVVCCSSCGCVMDFVGVTRPDGGGGLVYGEWDDDFDYANW